MSAPSQEYRMQSRFRLAKLDTPGLKLPAIAKPVSMPYEVSVLPAGGKAEPCVASAVRFGRAFDSEELKNQQLAICGFDAEILAQAEALVEAEPPAPMAALIGLPLGLESARPAKTALLGDAKPQPFSPSTVVSVHADLECLRNRLVVGPKPQVAASPAPEPKPAPAAKPEPASKPKITIRPAEPAKPARPETRRPTTMVARGNAQPVEQTTLEPKPAPAPSSEPKVIPIRKPEAAPVANDPIDLPLIGLATSPGRSPAAKGGIIAAALALLIGGGWFVFKGNAAKTAAATAAPVIDTAAPLAPLGGGGWTANWGADAPSNRGKQISLYRPTMALPDYRIELIGQIDHKAMGWVFRAQDPKNYYVMKLEQIKPGIEPVIALVKYAVLNGKEGTHTQVMLPIQATMTTMFKIRTDVKGNKFTTYVQDQLTDYWTDDLLKVGGAGLYVDPGERALIKTTNISALR